MRRTFILVLTLTTAFALAPAHAGRNAPATALPAAPFDARATHAPVVPVAAQLHAAETLRRATPEVRIEWNRRFGTPSSILRFGATLTGPGADAERVARTWLSANAAMFGWNAGDVTRLATIKTLTQPNGGPRTVLLHQTFGGLHGGSFGGSVTASLDKDNRLLSIRANVVRVAALAGSPRLDVTAATAIAGGLPAPPRILGRANEWTRLGTATLAGTHYAKLSAFPSGSGAARPVFEVFFTEAEDSVYRVAVDAIDGAILWRQQTVLNYAPEGRVFLNYPGAERGGTHEFASFRGDGEASPAGWISPVASTRKLPTTLGNNAITATHWVAGAAPDGPGEVRPVAPDYVFDEPFTDSWRTSDCGRTADQNVAPTYALDAMPAVVSLFYHHNVAHDYFWSLGFTAEAGAMQANNFGRAGMPGDPLLGLVQAGAAVQRNNAYMAPKPDGVPQHTGMYLWEPSVPGGLPPCVDGSFDAHVIYHEYAHGVTSRWVGGEWGNLSGAQGGAMGEAWSDFFGLHYLHIKGLETGTMVGAYVTGDRKRGIRNYALDENVLRYGDFTYDGGASVHSDGEIWSGTLWDMRTMLGRSMGPSGITYAAQITADAMPTSGPAPSMLDMRDAIVLADVARTGGRHQETLWEVFARHGMGASASTTGAGDTSPKQAFDAPDAGQNGRVTLRIVDPESGKPVWGAQVLAGTVEASRPLDETGPDGTVSFLMAAGPHILTVRVAGYGSRSVVVRAVAGRRVTTTVEFSPNYASSALGGKATSANPETDVSALIDDNKFTAAAIEPGTKGMVTIALGGTAPVVVREVRLAAGGGDSALDRFQVQTSTDGTTFRPILNGRLGRTEMPFDVGTGDRALRSWKLARPVTTTHVRLIAQSPQVAGTTINVADVQVFGSGDRFAVQTTAPLKLRVEGSMTVALPLTPDVAADASPTLTAMSLDCGIPPTQGVDAWVTEIDPAFTGARMRVEAPDLGDLGALPEFDVYYLDKACRVIGFAAAADPMPHEEGVIPGGTKYLVALHFAGPPTDVVVTAESAGRRLVRLGGPNPARRR